MVGTRLFIGGLSPDLDEASLQQQLAKFGSVLSVDVKDKKDITGEVVKRFAFATLDGPHASIEKCIYSLNGSTLNGSTLSVERAQESFIERLKREREARAAGKPLPHSESAVQKFNTRNTSSYESDYHSSPYDNNYKSGYDNDSWNEKVSYQTESKWGESDSKWSENSSQWPANDGKLASSGRSFNNVGNESIAENSMDVDLLPSFASYSSAWRDDDEPTSPLKFQAKSNGNEYAASLPQSAPKLPVMRRYDPTRAVAQTESQENATDEAAEDDEASAKVTPGVTISKDLIFSGASGTFSLLDLLEGKLDSPKKTTNRQEEEDKTEELHAHSAEAQEPPTDFTTPREVSSNSEEEESKSRQKKSKSLRKSGPETAAKLNAKKPYVKKEKFFIDAGDACVQEGLSWLYKEITDEAREEFRMARPTIVNLYMSRHRRALDEARGKRKAALMQNWWGSNEGDEDGSFEPVTLVSDVLRGVPSTVRSSFSEDNKTRSGVAKRTAPGKALTRGRGRGQMRGRGLPWGRIGRGANRVRIGSRERR